MTKIERRLEERGLLEQCRAIALKHNVLMKEICSRARTKRISEARRKVWKHLHKIGFSFPEIGRLFDRDHTTVVSVCDHRRRGR